MAERKKKGVVAPKYQQTVSRATPQAITALVKKLPAEAGPIEARKKALYDLTLMISNVTQQDQDALLKTSEEHNLVGILATLLKDAEEAEREAEQAGEEATEDADVSAIKVGRKTLGMDYALAMGTPIIRTLAIQTGGILKRWISPYFVRPTWGVMGYQEVTKESSKGARRSARAWGRLQTRNRPRRA